MVECRQRLQRYHDPPYLASGFVNAADRAWHASDVRSLPLPLPSLERGAALFVAAHSLFGGLQSLIGRGATSARWKGKALWPTAWAASAPMEGAPVHANFPAKFPEMANVAGDGFAADSAHRQQIR
jgi:hypothetical protein